MQRETQSCKSAFLSMLTCARIQQDDAHSENSPIHFVFGQLEDTDGVHRPL